MLFRSTGLGKTQLTGKVVEIKRSGDYLIMHVDTIEPVQWRIRAALSFRDLATIFSCLLRVATISFLLSPVQWFKKAAEHPGEF
ncbi:MAG TPA: hypothetical protein G4O13_00705 [Dehalococcoidia bacterium]|nr:hypothetical protein [Dehalococcoidia bacterium]